MHKDKKRKEKTMKIKIIVENPGIDPGTSRMLSERSPIWANSPRHVKYIEDFFTHFIYIYQDCLT